MEIFNAPQRARWGSPRDIPARAWPTPASPRFGRRNSGFTLIEVLVSVVIITVGILGVTAMQTASISGQVLSRNL
ncbi:MAG: prepilin-type N-terminal cleavage/methylation domain-containing protein, partial [Nitrospinota bacterium]|nr:prepilin-type N-terminal cleavage/methylation domain-containing protein [Nitrospinota bacterium]